MAQASVPGQLAGVACSGQLATDGLWARLRGGAKRVVLALTDSQSGLVWPPVVVEGEEKERDWQGLFERAAQAGLDLDLILGLTSDGAKGLSGYLKRALVWVNQGRCVWHLWRGLGGELAARVAEAGLGLAQAKARTAKQARRRELVALIRGVLDASAKTQARAALTSLEGHPVGVRLAVVLAEHWEAALAHLGTYNRGLVRVAPEWLWRDFRLGLGRGRNHATDVRLERAALVWAIYRNFTPAQRRSERNRHYRRPGKSPLEMAGVPPNEACYLDALGV